MNLLKKLKETSLSVVPLIIIVVILQFTIAPVGWSNVGRFAFGGFLIIIGLSLFLLGTDIGIIPVGRSIGSALINKRNLPLLLGVTFIIGLFITLAEPQVQVLARQVELLAPHISRSALTFSIALGVGLFVAVSFLRLILKLSYKWTMVVLYLLLTLLAIFADNFFLGIAFDAGGATTGPLTVPFILALGIGVAGVRKSETSEEDSFGFVGVSAIGPVAAVLVMGIVSRLSGNDPAASVVEGQVDAVYKFSQVFVETLLEVLQAIGPLALILIIFQLTILRQKRRQVIRMFEGLLYATIGLVLFLVGVNGAFMPVGSQIGALIGGSAQNWVLIPLGVFLGGVVVLAEPAVWVLTDQVKEVTGGAVKKSFILIFFSIGIALAVGLAMIRVIFRIHLAYFLIPGYLIALLLAFRSPPLFTTIAFDSGTVASGPMSSSFLLAFTLGASAASDGNPFTDAFGVVALIAMTPLISLQVLGLIYDRKAIIQKKGKEKRSTT